MLGKKEVRDFNEKVDTLIGKGTIIEGNLTTEAVTRLDGTVKGNIHTNGTLVIGQTGKVIGNISAKFIMVGGDVQGDLTAAQRIEVSSSGKVIGNIETKSLIVDENAKFQGQCIMNMGQTNAKEKTNAKENTNSQDL